MKNSKKRKLRIAILDMDSLKNIFWGAGQARSTYEIGKRLAKKHSVIVYTSKYPGYHDYTLDKIRYRHIGMNIDNPRLTNLQFVLLLPLFARRAKEDIILENFNAPFSVSLSPLFARKPLIGIPTMFDAERFVKKYHLPFDWFERFGSRFYKNFVPYTKYQDQKMKQFNPDILSKIIPEGVSDYYFSIKKRKPKHILFIGRFDISHKGIDLLIRAYAKVASKIHYPLIIAGHGPDEEKIRQLIEKLHLENKIRMTGYVQGEEKAKLMSEAIAVALPSRNEAFSCFALEALATGLPLVLFDVPGLSWIDTDVSLRAKPFDTDQYAKLLLNATDKKISRAMSRKARNFAKKFTWEKVAKDYEEFLYLVLQKNGGK